ncbi:MAG: TetR/AcrR family transcriptional regulator [Lachnospiraceae bacterium]
MANPDPTIDGKILESARKEFLARGFDEPSLRDICQKAGVTTGAFYKRYAGKEELFHAVVEQTLNDLESIIKQHSSFDITNLSDEQLCDLCDLGKHENTLLHWLEFLYERREDMFLLLVRSGNSQYANFQHDWVEKVMHTNYPVFEEIERRGLTEFHPTKKELHILQSAYWQTLYEPFIHEASWDEIKEHSKYISRFFNWLNALGFRLK